MSDVMAELRTNAGRVSSDLTETAAGVSIHHRVASVAAQGVGQLTKMAAILATESDMNDDVRQDIRRLMQPCYTMDRERTIHKTVMGDDLIGGTVTPQPDTIGDVDDFFL